MRTPDSYSVHDVSGHDNTGNRTGWVLIAEWLDENGDIEDTEEVSFHRSESQARAALSTKQEGGETP